jgi:outer membrane lipoprotein-sorting protein
MRELFILIILGISLFAFDADKLIKKVEDNLNAKSAIMQITMQVTTKRATRKMIMSSYSIGNKKSFIKISYPRKDKGITFLKLDNKMWQYVPKIERIIKIPASMMLQSWMGSDFTNDDLVKESSLRDDYNTTLIDESKKNYKLQLIPKEDTAIVWGKITMDISKKYYLPTTVNYYDEENILIRVLQYKNIKKIKNRYYPTYWQMTPKLKSKKGHKTIMKIDKVKFDTQINKSYFTKRALKRYSK